MKDTKVSLIMSMIIEATRTPDKTTKMNVTFPMSLVKTMRQDLVTKPLCRTGRNEKGLRFGLYRLLQKGDTDKGTTRGSRQQIWV